jgi:hypothetical protein
LTEETANAVTGRSLVRGGGPPSVLGSGLSAEGGAALLDGPDPLLRIQPEVAVGDDAGSLLERELGLLDQLPGSASGLA